MSDPIEKKLQDEIDQLLKEHRERQDKARITLGDLRQAWEQAEVPTESNPIREGDTVIYPVSGGHAVMPAPVDYWGRGDLSIRVLSRAPQPEPWQDLADVLADMGHLSPTGHAKALHERGVRVVGGDEA